MWPHYSFILKFDPPIKIPIKIGDIFLHQNFSFFLYQFFLHQNFCFFYTIFFKFCFFYTKF